MQVGQRQLLAEQPRPFCLQRCQNLQHCLSPAESTGDQRLIGRHLFQPFHRHVPDHGAVAIGVEHAGDLAHPGAGARVGRLQGRTVEGFIDIASDGTGLEQTKTVMLEGRDAAERVKLQIPGRNALGGEDVERDQLVADALLLQRHPRDAYIDAVVRAVESWLGHRSALPSARRNTERRLRKEPSTFRDLGLPHRLLQILVDLVEEAGGGEPGLVRADQQRQVLGHEARLDGLDADLLQRLGEALQLGIVVKFGAMREAARPGEDRGDRVGRGFLALLVLAIMAGDGAVRGFRFHRLAVRRHQHGGHQAERAEALRHGIRLHVAVIVLAGPHVTARPLQARSDHVVDQAVLVPEFPRLEFGLEFLLVDLLEDILEAAVIGLEDGVLGRQIDWEVAQQAIVQRGAGEFADRFVEIVHGHGDAGARRVIDIVLDHLAVLADELDRQLALAGEAEVGGAILVAEGVTADDDRLGPARHQARHVLHDDRLAEDGAAEDVADGAVGRLPHLLQLEFLDARLVGGDGRAFHADAPFLDGVGRVDRHLVVGGVAVLDAEVVIFKLQVEIGVDQLVLDELPDDAGHLVAVEFDDRVRHLDLRHGKNASLLGDLNGLARMVSAGDAVRISKAFSPCKPRSVPGRTGAAVVNASFSGADVAGDAETPQTPVTHSHASHRR
ncbi:NADP-dependent isocitrate dehydrogenase (modular protein) [Mesorhizobium plurifarium]|uniref:NADP-dependent isocitrate dehydrogenase (Modular protein) n=1 Tax=Mesorhizobium plurifarium TaxID=69974 RepID=A0A0K2W240_MESPL|nr:NADP-dependent isocitrate dehydrogenase (modular protein) [Mesorhizobium plurifarium]